MGLCLEVTTHWRGTLLSLKHFSDPKALHIGRGKGTDLNVEDPDVPVDSFELVHNDAQKLIVRNATWMALSLNGRRVTEPSVQLRENDVVTIEVGGFEICIRYVATAQPVPALLVENFDFRYALLLLFLFIVQSGLLIQLNLMPVRTKEPDLLKSPQVFRDVVVKIQKKEKKRAVAEAASSAGSPAPEPEGLVGEKDKPHVDKLPAPQGSKMAVENTPVRSQTAALNMLKKLGLRDAGSMIGSNGLSGAGKGLLGLRGTQVGIAGGNGGLGTKGTGSGGGGKALGAGGLGTGKGFGLGGNGDFGLGGKGRGRTRIIPGDIFYEGGLTREEIQRVVDRFMSQIKFCYEHELQQMPKLEGKLTANWTIAPDGRVRISNLGDSTLSNGNVEQCVLKIVNRMIFPEPRGGGIVKVNFPFVFSTAGL